MWSGPKLNTCPAGTSVARLGASTARLCSVSGAAHDRHGSGRDVVVVPAGVVARCPAEHPDVDVGVAVQREVVPLLGARDDVFLPQLRTSGDGRGEGAQFGLVQLPVGQTFEAAEVGAPSTPRWVREAAPGCPRAGRRTRAAVGR